MRNDQDGHAVLLDQLADAILALLLKHEVADGEHLIDDEDLRNNDGCNGECDAGHHAGREILQRHIKEFLYFSEFDDLVKVFVDEVFRIA